MAKLTIKAAPTFSAKVGIPQAGAEPVEMVFVFKHRTKAELQEFMASREGKPDAESFVSMVESWDFDEPMTPENVETMLQNYIGAGLAVYVAYIGELTKAKAKN